jgi:DNA-binding FadR family transcriptional regulator
VNLRAQPFAARAGEGFGLPRGGSERPQLGHNLTFGLLHAIGGAIAAGQYDDTPFPTESDLADQYGTSLSVTREAVKMLAAKGLLASRPRQGTYVQPLSCWSLLDIDVLRWLLERRHSVEVLRQFDQLRIAIEPAAAEFAARFAWPRDVQRIARAFESLEACFHDGDDMLPPQIAFHTAILQASRNPFYAQFRDAVGTALHIADRLRRRLRGEALDLAAYAAVHAAIEAGKGEAARDSMHAIIADGFEFAPDAGGRAEVVYPRLA